MMETASIILTLLPVLAIILYQKLRDWRYKKFAHIPTGLKSNLFIGHMGYLSAGFKKAATPHIHPDHIFEDMWREQGCPEFLFLDIRPARYPLLLITSHELAEQVTRTSKQQPYSVPKSPTVSEIIRPITGDHSMLTGSGEEWKVRRKLFNPAFAPQHMRSLLPVLFDQTAVFMKRLDELVGSGHVAEIEALCTNLTFDIIGKVVMNVDYNAQGGSAAGGEVDETFRHFMNIMSTFAKDDGVYPIHLDLPVQIRRRIHSRRFDIAVKRFVQNKFEAIRVTSSAGSESPKDQSVLALALRDIESLTPEALQTTSDQIKTFLLAGHDTTATLLQRLFYALSIHPTCLAKIRAEHDAVFGTHDPREMFLALPEETVKALKYTSAVIKETLRLWPPGATARMSHDGFKLRTSEGDICIDNCIIYLIPQIIHRDAKVYGPTADEFVPERWIECNDTEDGATPNGDTSARTNKIPAGAWRPFERGPRDCIGQELALNEARVVLACVIRRYDFVKVGMGEVEVDDKGQPVVDNNGKYKTKSELMSRMAVTSKPIDRMRMRVKFRAE